MRITYIAPRYHTNQIAVVNGWLARGDEVQYIVRAAGAIEDYSNIQPVMVPYARSFELIFRIYMRLNSKSPIAHDLGLRYGYPSSRAIRSVLVLFKPDLVILRERSIYSIVCYRVCKRLGIRTLLYNQSPLWESPDNIHTDLPHRIMDRLLPLPRITPVRKKDHSVDGKVLTDRSYFVPFVTELYAAAENRSYCADGIVQILEIGRFERRKNHLLMLEAFERVYRTSPNVRLTIVGEVISSFHKDYCREVQQYIEDHQLQDVVRILKNYDYSEMKDLYIQSDLFVLASTGEPAAISPLEAMACGVPAISSTGNGTADYIEDGVTGHIFADKDVDSLVDAITDIVSDPARIAAMGHAAYEHIKRHYQFDNYYRAIMQINE